MVNWRARRGQEAGAPSTGDAQVVSRALSLGVVASAVLFAAVLWVIGLSWVQTGPVNACSSEVAGLSGEIMHLDEVLTMSARMAAATGDPRWRARYDANVPVLDGAIARLRAISPERFDAQLGAVAAEANARLIEAETRAFALTEAGRGAEALELLAGAAYAADKAAYAASMNEAKATIGAEARRRVVALEGQMLAAGVASLSAVVLVAFAWTRAFGVLRRFAVTQRATAEARAGQLAAEASDRLKSQFLANMSHELRTPITSIIGYAESVLGGEHGEAERVRRVRVIRDSAQHLSNVLNDVLDISRIEIGEMRLNRTRCEPANLLESARSVAAPLVVGRAVSIRVEVDPGAAEPVWTDGTRVSQILINLTTNAVKFTERGEIRLSVTRGGDEGGTLVFEVRDTGPGIPLEDLERVFEPFEQADNTMKRRHGGVGLGLPISRRLARMLGGELSVRSEIGVGSVFTLRLPATPVPAEAEGLAVDGAVGACGEALEADGGAGPMRALLAEDVEVNRELFAEMLMELGYEVVQAEHGGEAVAAVKREGPGAFGLIFMDMQMPEMDGYEATRRLRAAGVRAPIVAITAHAMAGDRERCTDVGCDDHLAKPFGMDKLAACCAAWQGRGSTWSGAAGSGGGGRVAA